jgi:hypothetical protein
LSCLQSSRVSSRMEIQDEPRISTKRTKVERRERTITIPRSTCRPSMSHGLLESNLRSNPSNLLVVRARSRLHSPREASRRIQNSSQTHCHVKVMPKFAQIIAKYWHSTFRHTRPLRVGGNPRHRERSLERLDLLYMQELPVISESHLSGRSQQT